MKLSSGETAARQRRLERGAPKDPCSQKKINGRYTSHGIFNFRGVNLYMNFLPGPKSRAGNYFTPGFFAFAGALFPLGASALSRELAGNKPS